MCSLGPNTATATASKAYPISTYSETTLVKRLTLCVLAHCCAYGAFVDRSFLPMERFGPFNAIESEPANWLQPHTDQTQEDKELQLMKYCASQE